MKRTILLIVILAMNLSGFSQNLPENISGRNKLNFEENTAASEVKIYPNPCKEEIVTIEFNKQEIREISLTNITGKEVFLKTYQITENKKQIQLNDIPNGIYILKIRTSDEKMVIKKLMVAKV